MTFTFLHGNHCILFSLYFRPLRSCWHTLAYHKTSSVACGFYQFTI